MVNIMTIKKKAGRPRLVSEDILAEALFQIFACKGYANTSINDLTLATGMKPASLYLAYGNKPGMYAAAMEYYRKTWLSGLVEILSDEQIPFEQRMRKFLHAAFELFSCDGKPAGCMMTFSALAFQNDKEGLAGQLSNERQAFTEWMEKEAEKAQQAGELPADITPQEFACFVVTLEKGLALGALDKPVPEVISAMIDRVMTRMFAKI